MWVTTKMVEPWNWTGERVAFAMMHLVTVWDLETKKGKVTLPGQ